MNQLIDMEWISRSGHDFCSPSTLQLRAACPGSARRLKLIEQSKPALHETSKAASRGVRLHGLTVDILTDNLVVETFVDLTQEDKQQIKWCAKRTKEIINRLAGQNVIVIYEEQIDLSELGISGGKHGCRIDCLILIPGYGAIVIDWKFGRHWVTIPEYNLQTKAYAWGVHTAYGGDVETIILQPQSPEGREYMSCLIKDDQFKDIGEQIKQIVLNTKKPDAPLIRGPHCEEYFCSLRDSACPLWNKSLLEIPDDQNIASYFKTLSPADRKKLYEHIKTITHVAKCCEETIKILCIDGGLEIEGYSIKDGRPDYICNDLETMINALMPYAKEKNLSENDLFNAAIPPTAKNKSDYLKMLGNKKHIRDILDTLFIKVVGRKILKRMKE